MTRTIAALLVLLALAGGAAHALGIGHLGMGIGKLGATAPGCTNQLNFSVACNSQYLTVLH